MLTILAYLLSFQYGNSHLFLHIHFLGREKFLKLLGKATIEKLKSSKSNKNPNHIKEKIHKISSFLNEKEQIWFQYQLDEELFNLEVKP